MRSFPKKGFTLIELVMTILIVAIIAIPVSMVIRQHYEAVFESGDSVAAMHLARLEMEKVRNMAYAIIGNHSYTQDGYQIDRTMTYARGDAYSLESVKQISVSVRKVGGTQTLYDLTMHLAKNVTYGI